MSKVVFDPATMRARFWELKAQRDGIRSQTVPLREKRDAIEAEARKLSEEIIAQVRDLEKPIADIKDEMATIARALGGKTGPKPE